MISQALFLFLLFFGALKNFTARSDTIFCGVFDGHGKDGHLVAKAVRDTLPSKLETCQKTLLSKYENRKQHVAAGAPSVLLEDPDLIITWKESLLNAYKLMDQDLLIDDQVDCVSSGTTAVTLVKQVQQYQHTNSETLLSAYVCMYAYVCVSM
jgi:serine/threonine protein phosphatase PrpC